MKSNDSTDYTMATDVNPLKYVEKQGKYMGIYLEKTDCLVAGVT